MRSNQALQIMIRQVAGSEREAAMTEPCDLTAVEARALIGAKAGDEVEVDAPAGAWRARVLDVT